MKLTFGPARNARNIAERGSSFECARNLGWVHAVVLEDTRKDYGERRFRVFG